VVTVGVLGDEAGASAVPLLDLVASAAPGVGPVAVAVIAAVVALGVLNLYLGAFAKLGASLGRDGDLPKWMASGAESGGIPRRSLAVVAGVVAVYLGALIAFGLDLTPFILVHTSCMIAIYVLGMIAAVRLLERWTVGWWLALISVALVAGLVVLAGANLLVPAALGVSAVVVTLARGWRRRSAMSRAAA
jgi:amino acid efflux transporter